MTTDGKQPMSETSRIAPPLEYAAGFRTPLTVTGPLRAPRQMLAEQVYGDHASIHDGAVADDLGLAGAPIEGPTHFSQFDPLCVARWGTRWFERGCISAHFRTMCVEGDGVRAELTTHGGSPDTAAISAEKADGTPVLTGTASVDPHAPTEVRARLARATPPQDPVILADITVGQRGADTDPVTMGADTHMGELYPFSLGDKLAAITEYSPWYDTDSPWGGPIIPFEMVSVLTMSTSHRAGFVRREPSIGLFLDLEVRMLAGPLFVGATYTLEREVVALGESRRTESYWTSTTVRDRDGAAVAEVLLHEGVFKESYPDYPTDRLPV